MKMCNYSAEVEAYSLKKLKIASRLTMIDRMHRISSGILNAARKLFISPIQRCILGALRIKCYSFA